MVFVNKTMYTIRSTRTVLTVFTRIRLPVTAGSQPNHGVALVRI